MKFWQKYLQKQKPEYIEQTFPKQFGADLIVVIPCYDEPDILITLQNLTECELPHGNVLVAIIINSSVRCAKEVVKQNRNTYDEIIDFGWKNNTEKLSFFPLIFENLPRKHAGVGLARKIGMDLSVSHFMNNCKQNGIIISLDADCKVSNNFFTSIEKAYQKDLKLNCTVHNFHHRPENGDQKLENAIRQYESHLRYFSKTLKTIGFPYYFHTIGSAFSVSADAYVRTGGMGRQQGGEDFYFLQKIFALEQTVFLEDLFVFPLARFSHRIPFGTGPALQKIINSDSETMQTYQFAAFLELKKLFDLQKTFFETDASQIGHHLQSLPPTLRQFCLETNVEKEIEDCKKHSASYKTFRKRFFHHFNAFKIIKFLNFAHEKEFSHSPVEVEIQRLHLF